MNNDEKIDEHDLTVEEVEFPALDPDKDHRFPREFRKYVSQEDWDILAAQSIMAQQQDALIKTVKRLQNYHVKNIERRVKKLENVLLVLFGRWKVLTWPLLITYPYWMPKLVDLLLSSHHP